MGHTMTDYEMFLEKLKIYSPEGHKLFTLGEIDTHLWTAVKAILSMRDLDVTGEVHIRFHSGHIDKVVREEDMTYGAVKRKANGQVIE